MEQSIEKYRPDAIHRFGLDHFKAFKETAFLPIRPITVLAGLNSSGKSAIIDALLLLKQTLLAERRVGGRLVLDWGGPFFEVGYFYEMVYDLAMPGDFTFRFEIRYPVSEQHRQNKYIQTKLLSEKTDYIWVGANFTFKSEDFNTNDLAVAVALDARTQATPSKMLFLSINEEDQKVKLSFVDEAHDQIEYYGGVEAHNSGGIKANISFSYFLPIWTEKEDTQRYELYTIYRDLFQPAIQTIQDELLKNIKYLGPLREDPKRFYSQKQLRWDDVGARGENAVLLLQHHWQREVDFVKLPEDNSEVVSWAKLIPVKVPLGRAVNEALRWLGMQRLLKAEEDLIITAEFPTLSNEATSVTIADIGFGVSQVLPVLTHGLLANTNSILILEQPEIHLHPRAQARLAELLVCLARTGRRIIIETHSDHLINRLRRIAGEDLSNQLADLVSIVFVQPPRPGEGARLDLLRVNEEGIIENWPPGFLAETAEDAKAIVKAGIRKRQQNNQSQR